ncbi:MAG: extracellular solute-binding protein [Clostridiales Family XIII bacterium]|nr:extracellular solute-binding protein [Clostridiales Family XIII bacterium]
MKKRLLGLLLAVMVVFTFSFTACGGSDKSSDSDSDSKDSGKKTVNVWAWDETFNIKAVEEAKKVYSSDDYDVKVVTMSQDDIVQKLNTSLASGSTDGLPEIVLIEDYRIQGYLTSYPDAFADLSSIVDEDAFSPYKFAVNKVDDKIYGVPFDSGVTGFFYRTDYLGDAGYDDAALQDITWDEFLEIGKAVKEKTGHALFSLNPSDLGLVRAIMQSAGTWYNAEDGETITIDNNPALAYGINIYAQFLKDGIVEQVADWDGGVNAVQSGSVAGSPQGCWYSSTITGADDQSGKWRIAPLPKIANDAKATHSSSIGGAGWYVIKGLPGEENAIDFLDNTFASSTDLMATLATEIGLVSTMKAAADTAPYQEANEFYSGQKVLEDFSKLSTGVPEVNYGQNTYVIESVMAEYVQQIIDGKDVDKVLKEAQKQVEAQVAN